jgi:hypothetical protein
MMRRVFSALLPHWPITRLTRGVGHLVVVGVDGEGRAACGVRR